MERRKLMATLTVLKFKTPNGAEQMLTQIRSLQKQELITLNDAAIAIIDQAVHD